MVRRAPRPPRLSPLAARRRRARGRHAPVRRSRGSRRGEVVLRGKTRNAGRSLSSPSASEPADGPLRRESQGILVFPFRTTPRRSRRGRRCRLRVRRAPRSWLTGAGATGMVTRRQCWSSCFQDALPSQRRAHAPHVRAAEGRPRAGRDHGRAWGRRSRQRDAGRRLTWPDPSSTRISAPDAVAARRRPRSARWTPSRSSSARPPAQPLRIAPAFPVPARAGPSVSRAGGSRLSTSILS